MLCKTLYHTAALTTLLAAKYDSAIFYGEKVLSAAYGVPLLGGASEESRVSQGRSSAKLNAVQRYL
jgi:hypothetical protein